MKYNDTSDRKEDEDTDDRRGPYTDDESRAMSRNRGSWDQSRRNSMKTSSILEHRALPSRSRVDDMLQHPDERSLQCQAE